MKDLKYQCPKCRTALVASKEGDFDTWRCEAGHGVGVTLTEAYGHFQDDEIHAIWKSIKDAPTSGLKSPALGQPMVAVTVVVDDDEVEGNQGPGARLVTLDVAPDEQFLWFHVSDFDAMPTDLPNPPPTPEQLAKLEQLRAQSSEAVRDDLASEDDPLTELGQRFGSWAAAKLHMTRFMDKLSARSVRNLKR